MKLNLQNYKTLIIVILFFVVEYIFLKDLPFFWDAVSKSMRAQWFYETNFSQLVLPVNLNSGHPPFWPVLIAVWWKSFGVTLAKSRVLLLIINILVGFQLIKLFKNTFPKKQNHLLVLIILLEPTLLAQTTIFNNDMILLLFTLMAYNIIVFSKEKKELLLTFAFTGILFSNLRGMLLLFCLLVIQLIFIRYKLSTKKFNYKPYLISILFFSVFLIYQYSVLGWIIKTPSVNWSEQRNVADVYNILKNIASIGRNLLDYGRIVLFGITFYLLYFLFKKKQFHPSKTSIKLMISIVVFTVGMSIFFMFFTNPIGHRYYMISYILVVLLFLVLVDNYKTILNYKRLYVIVIIAFITGHFWIYPSTISQGWDSSLAYLNYFKLRDDIELFIEKNKILKENIGTNLPLNEKEYSDLLKVDEK
ncbi:Dolichyl-phosphate-mannose-protein mannosyltransferase [Lutibacter agarilyticus]|uniref:Dolichyl-phosphate-mannose-protein mannosyltransferase n=1 Tax=Lutibacter agarilyticus TaxID=1109740 RepID=A0A238VEF2_9FLAO|nr:glycosyltransferase family 39 protein [Lutibacter agarilyticus]SNR32782.1 Dolichyl-phosphate-mannose-protein mannosyltransferase [Lutibacter agarilyticus]